MSKTIDERVVSMQFDNKHFEKNAQTSLNTLAKLKQSLNLSGASKGLENVGAAAGKINMSNLSSAVDAVNYRFSALDVVGSKVKFHLYDLTFFSVIAFYLFLFYLDFFSNFLHAFVEVFFSHHFA